MYGSGTANKMLCEFGNKYRELVGEIEKAAVQGEAQDWNSHLQNLFGFRRMRDFFFSIAFYLCQLHRSFTTRILWARFYRQKFYF